MTEKIQYLSQDSFDKLQKEQEDIKDQKIPSIANRIDEAKQQGDLSENAEYHQAKEDMAWAHGRLLELSQILSNATIIKKDESNCDTVSVGHTVEVEFSGKKKEYTIVGAQEADPFKGLISNESPLGGAFVGCTIGDEIEIETPSGKQLYKILNIK